MNNIPPFYLDLDEDAISRFLEGAERVLRSGMLILGKETETFENAFASYIGAKHAVAVSSGTSALEILLKIKGVRGRTVLVPTNTNFATVAAVLYAGGSVAYLDMDEATFAPTLDMVRERLEDPSADEIAGVAWVHIGGVISPEFPAVVEYCRGMGRFVIEDAAHAHGSALGGVRSGALADGGAFSFFPTKVMTTFEGGMITTDSADEAELARSFRNQGKRGTKFGGLHHDLGNSHRMLEPSAVLGQIFLAKLDDMLDRRDRAYRAMTQVLSARGVSFVSADHMDRASHYKLIVRLPDGVAADDAKATLREQGVIAGGGVYEIPCHLQPVFEGLVEIDRPLPVAERWCPAHICPPLTSGVTEADATRVGEAVADCLAGAEAASA